MPRPLLIPCETRSRELDAKLLLACAGAERGLPCLVGSRTEMHRAAGRLPRGIYLAKDVRRSSLRMLRILRRLGHDVAAWDEEALVLDADPERNRRRLCAESLREVSHLFAWGAAQVAELAGHPVAGGLPVHATGNPRLDLLRPELRGFHEREEAAVVARFGRPLLVNTNFGSVNHFLPAQSDPPHTPRAAQRRALFEHFLALVPVLSAAFPERAIVVRPHPAESHAPWHRAAAGLPNVHVVQEGTVVPWLRACAALVHNGCTTALEGWLLGVAAVTFRPEPPSRYDRPLPDALSEPAPQPDAVCAAVAGILERAGRGAAVVAPDEARRRDTLVRRHVAALDGALACDRIVDVLEAVAAARRPPPPRGVRLGARLHAAGRAALQRGVRARIPGHKNSAAYQRQRFPDVSAVAVRDAVDRFGKCLGRFGALEVREARELGPNLFWIQPASG